MLGVLSLMIRHVLEMGATGISLVSVSSPNLKKGNRVQGTLTFIGVQNLEELYLIPRREMDVRCSVLERSVLSVVVFTVESADRAQMPA